VKYGWNYAEPLNVQVETIADAVKIVEAFNPRQREGFILRDKNNIRLKVKSTAYLRVNYLS
jgi:ATP-dependent RNA circularization protein (DNA/RNA ligase family)